ncbi:DALR anticodon-binding domain-containing protein, partial [Angustibacter speluncae]
DHVRVVDVAAATGEPHRLVRHLDDVGALVHRWLDLHPWPGGDPADPAAVTGGDEDATRLGLARSVRAVLAEGLGLLGATAPERV